MTIVRPTNATFQETTVTGNNQMKVKDYFCFQRNREVVKSWEGVATLVENEVKN